MLSRSLKDAGCAQLHFREPVKDFRAISVAEDDYAEQTGKCSWYEQQTMFFSWFPWRLKLEKKFVSVGVHSANSAFSETI